LATAFWRPLGKHDLSLVLDCYGRRPRIDSFVERIGARIILRFGNATS